MKLSILSALVIAGTFAIPGLVFNNKSSTTLNTLDVAKLFAAGEKPTDECHTAFQAILDAKPKRGDYLNGVLDHLHMELYRANKIQSGDIEMIFCRLGKVLGVSPDLTSLPQTYEKTDPRGSTVKVVVETPTEDWAIAAGYEAKASISNDGTQFMALWWAGSQDASKGYVIQGSNPMQTDTTKRLRYAQWDKTTENQSMKVLATSFATSFLGSVTGAADSKTGGDNAHFARLNYNTTSKAVTAQAVEIRGGRKATTAFKCVRTYFTGTLGGTIDGWRPAKGTEETVDETSKGSDSAGTGSGCTEENSSTATNCGLDSELALVDSKTTADKSGTIDVTKKLDATTFDYSCNDVNTGSATGKPFAGNTVSFTMSPSTIFPR